jgi:hypothetical protein
MGKIGIFTLLASFNLMEQREIFLSLSLNIVALWPVFCTRAKFTRLLEQNSYKQS